MNKAAVVLSILFLMFSFMGCSEKATGPTDTGNNDTEESAFDVPTVKELPVTDPAVTTAVTANNDFALRLFKAINGDSADANVFISPLSVSIALGMVYNGAGGYTRQAIQNSLGLYGLTADEINSAYYSLIKYLTSLDPGVIFEIANSNWIRDGFEVEQAFIDFNRKYFNADVNYLDFSLPDAADIINAWVNEKTHGKIEDIVDPPINDGVMMYLINAVYFLGNWTYQFDPDDTEDQHFYLSPGNHIDHPTMTYKAEISYYNNASFTGVELPYGDGKFSMLIFMPHDFDPGINDFVENMTPEFFDTYLPLFHTDSVNFYLPKFKIELDYDLIPYLSQLGMSIAFAGGADFTGINPGGGLFITKVRHKTFIDVNEEGTEAAAATMVEVYLGPSDEVYIYITRPFVFFIRDSQTGAILFMGKIMQPML